MPNDLFEHIYSQYKSINGEGSDYNELLSKIKTNEIDEDGDSYRQILYTHLDDRFGDVPDFEDWDSMINDSIKDVESSGGRPIISNSEELESFLKSKRENINLPTDQDGGMNVNEEMILGVDDRQTQSDQTFVPSPKGMLTPDQLTEESIAERNQIEEDSKFTFNDEMDLEMNRQNTGDLFIKEAERKSRELAREDFRSMSSDVIKGLKGSEDISRSAEMILTPRKLETS